MNQSVVHSGRVCRNAFVWGCIFVIFISCDDGAFQACENTCFDAQDACESQVWEARDSCKIECREVYPEYVKCYWDCRIDSTDVAACLTGCERNQPNGTDGATCITTCDDVHEQEISECVSIYDRCDEACLNGL